jgi:hypothetical protein
MGLVGILVALGYEGLSLELREWLEDMASYRLFIEPYLQRVTRPTLYKGDGHPTPLANRLKASIIKDYIEHHVPGILVAGRQ